MGRRAGICWGIAGGWPNAAERERGRKQAAVLMQGKCWPGCWVMAAGQATRQLPYFFNLGANRWPCYLSGLITSHPHIAGTFLQARTSPTLWWTVLFLMAPTWRVPS